MVIALLSSGSIKLIVIRHVSDQTQVVAGACNELEPLRFPGPAQRQPASLEHPLPLGTAVGGSCWAVLVKVKHLRNCQLLCCCLRLTGIHWWVVVAEELITGQSIHIWGWCLLLWKIRSRPQVREFLQPPLNLRKIN